MMRMIVLRDLSFNSRTPGGVRQRGFSPLATTSTCFNSRTPGGVRLTLCAFGLVRPTSFNSRTPGGVRRWYARLNGGVEPFQFTHPGRGATAMLQGTRALLTVSIHAPREGCDSL